LNGSKDFSKILPRLTWDFTPFPSKHMRTRRRGGATVNSTRERGWCWNGQCNCLVEFQKSLKGVDVGMEMNACKIQHFVLSLIYTSPNNDMQG
jgi:hypothetical protein